MNNRSLQVLSIAFIAFACSPSTDTRATAAREIIQTDSAMSVLAQQEGFFNALLHYADESFVWFREGAVPAIGKAAYQERVAGKPGTKALEWWPVKAEVARSGDLGYSWGKWKFTAEDTTLNGVYFSAWKRSADGSWKLALDGGNTTPSF